MLHIVQTDQGIPIIHIHAAFFLFHSFTLSHKNVSSYLTFPRDSVFEQFDPADVIDQETDGNRAADETIDDEGRPIVCMRVDFIV